MPLALPTWSQGLIAVLVGYTSSVVLIIQAARPPVLMQPRSLPGYGHWGIGMGSAASASPFITGCLS